MDNVVHGQKPPGTKTPYDKIPLTKPPWDKSPLGKKPLRTKTPYNNYKGLLSYFHVWGILSRGILSLVNFCHGTYFSWGKVQTPIKQKYPRKKSLEVKPPRGLLYPKGYITM